MTKLTIDLTKPFPSYLTNWGRHYGLIGQPWDVVFDVFTLTTSGKMEGEKGALQFDLVFEYSIDATHFLLKWT